MDLRKPIAGLALLGLSRERLCKSAQLLDASPAVTR